MSSQHIESSKNPGSADVANKVLIAILPFLYLLETLAKAKNNDASAACAFCNAKIPYGQSMCPACMKKYNIRSYDLSNDGCGCDK